MAGVFEVEVDGVEHDHDHGHGHDNEAAQVTTAPRFYFRTLRVSRSETLDVYRAPSS